jgi:hypothetical protein
MRKRRPVRPVSAGPLALAFVLAAAVAVSGCGIGKVVTRTKQSFGGDLHMKVMVHSKVNLNSPVAVNLVLFQDKKLIPEVQEYVAEDWFRFRREEFFNNHKKGVYQEYWEWVPGQQVEPEVITIKAGTKEGFIFANYISPGSHRENIDPREHFTLRLGERRFEVVTEK